MINLIKIINFNKGEIKNKTNHLLFLWLKKILTLYGFILLKIKLTY